MSREHDLAAVAEEVLSQVRSVVPAELQGELSLDTSLHELGVDSVAVMEAINRIEETFGMRFREEWLYDIDTCQDVANCVVAHMTKSLPERPAAESAAAPASGDAAPAAQPPAPAAYDVALFPECVAFHQRLRDAEQAGLKNPFFRTVRRVSPPEADVDGHDVVRYTSFDYLGLSAHPRVVSAAKEAIDRFGTSSSASRLVGGNLSTLEELDRRLASFLGTESAIVFPSGYGTNASLFGHLFGPEDLILYDELAHNSIATGAQLSRAKRRPFAHNDADALDRLLNDVRGNYRRVVVAVEGVYSMDGDYPDLPRFLEIKKRHGALLYVDEAHSIGVLGPGGRGLCEHFGVSATEGDLWMGTISKALASGGGYLAGRESLMRYLKYTTPAFVFATACSPANAAAALAALEVIEDEPQCVKRLQDRAALFLRLAKERGMNTGDSHDTPVIPVILGDSMRCVAVSHALLQQGIDAQPILYPAVRESAARVRFFITAAHTEQQIARTVAVLAECIAQTSPERMAC